MKILIISPRFPFKQGKADSMTIYHLIEFLHRKGHQVLLATFDNGERFSQTEREQLKAMCTDVRIIQMKRWKKAVHVALGALEGIPFQTAYYRRPKMQQQVDELIQKHQPDILYAHLIRTSHYLKKHTNTPRVVAMQIAQTLNYSRLVKYEKHSLRKLFYTQEYRRVRAYEPKVIEEFERILLISPHDKAAISPNKADEKVFFNPHGIDVTYYAKNLQLERQKNVIAMNGDFGVPTNIDGAMYFYNSIYPRVKATIPDAKLWLVGRNPHPSIQKLAEQDSSVTVTGRVPDIRPFLQQASVGIAPMRVAAGLQNKILVNLASQLPTVVTSISNEGIGAPENEVLLQATTANEFADKVIALLQNPEKRTYLGKNSLQFMQARWTWDFHFEKLEAMFLQLVENPNAVVCNYYPFQEQSKVLGVLGDIESN